MTKDLSDLAKEVGQELHELNLENSQMLIPTSTAFALVGALQLALPHRDMVGITQTKTENFIARFVEYMSEKPAISRALLLGAQTVEEAKRANRHSGVTMPKRVNKIIGSQWFIGGLLCDGLPVQVGVVAVRCEDDLGVYSRCYTGAAFGLDFESDAATIVTRGSLLGREIAEKHFPHSNFEDYRD